MTLSLQFPETLHITLETGMSPELEARLLKINNKLKTIMGLISEFAASQNAFNEAQASAIDEAAVSAGALTKDVAELNRLLQELKNRPGEDTPENRDLLNAILAKSEANMTRVKGLAAALKTLDEQTPPTVPAEPPTEPPAEAARRGR